MDIPMVIPVDALNNIQTNNLGQRKYNRDSRTINYGNVSRTQQTHNIFAANNISLSTLPNFSNVDKNQSKENPDWDRDDTYRSILNSIASFRKTDKWGEGSRLKLFDTPSQFYFKIFFYFGGDNLLSTDYDINIFPENLIQPIMENTTEQQENTSNSMASAISGWKLPDTITHKEFTNNPQPVNGTIETSKYLQSTAQAGFEGKTKLGKSANTAFNYLLINQEYQRAEKLLKFIQLLQDISVDCPWYFRSIAGLDVAVERKEFDRDFKIEDNRKELTIKCLADAFDTRIGTLLDLYRDIVISYEMYKEIVPANLRKFDMGVYIFEAPNAVFHKKSFDNRTKAEVTDNDMKYIKLNEGNTKYIEFHNCEIDYNSSKSGFNEINNEEGYSPEYVITIKYDTANEERYNNTLNMVIGDFYNWDIIYDDNNPDNDKYRGDNLTGHVKDFKFMDMSEQVRILKGVMSSNIFDPVKRIAAGNLYRQNIYRETIGKMTSKKISESLNEGRNKITGYVNDKALTPIDNARSYMTTQAGNIIQKTRGKLSDSWSFGRLWKPTESSTNEREIESNTTQTPQTNPNLGEFWEESNNQLQTNPNLGRLWE